MTDAVPPAEEPKGRALPRASELLRAALVDDEDPRFPRWLPFPGLALAAAWAAFQAVSAGEATTFVATLVWPGAALFAFGTVAAFLGWQLDID